MMWDLSGASSPSVAMPIPSVSGSHREHGHHHVRSSSVPGPPTPGWSLSRGPTPTPMQVPTSFINSDAGSYNYQPTPRGFLHPNHAHAQPAHHAHAQPAHHAHAQPVHRVHAQPVHRVHAQPVHHRPHSPAPPRHHDQHHHAAPPPVPRPIVHHRPLLPAVAPHFLYSKCTGRRRALCIGVNYTGQQHELHGCINDAKHVFSFLVRHAGYKAEDIVVLTDDSPHARGLPTRKNIIDAMHWLVQGAKTHDALFFHYSGHGGQTRDKDGDEVDGYDEVIFPVDYKRNGHIVDDEMHDIMVKPLPTGCRLTAVFDSCHSGTALDLPFIYDHHGRLKGRQISPRAILRKATTADVISLSGCKDGGTSMDTFADGQAVGAASHAFIKAIEAHPHQSYRDFLRNIRVLLHPKFSQKPQLGSSHPIDTSLRFIM
ncbi:caspase domain-containing protein [Mycena metata]|uniref:Caspase domain-containing protein n=1 Tax=Mycena metata TaxID=1033252 RepID=A0AAD7I9H2_9AGAR|nr:caspase domain-containing protein [Mycena metata]